MLPSLSSSTKIASTGEVIGTVQQDRATTIAGTLGPGPSLIPITLTLNVRARHAQDVHDRRSSATSCSRRCSPTSSILNTLTSYERQNGVGQLRVQGRGDASRSTATSPSRISSPAISRRSAPRPTSSRPINFLLRNAFEDVEIEGLNLEIDASEQPRSATLERVWIDGTRAEAGLDGRR